MYCPVLRALYRLYRPLQRGIDLATLDVSYFTSLSFYILLLFGLRGVFSLVFRDETVDEVRAYCLNGRHVHVRTYCLYGRQVLNCRAGRARALHVRARCGSRQCLRTTGM